MKKRKRKNTKKLKINPHQFEIRSRIEVGTMRVSGIAVIGVVTDIGCRDSCIMGITRREKTRSNQ
jgi:hypothetical protein